MRTHALHTCGIRFSATRLLFRGKLLHALTRSRPGVCRRPCSSRPPALSASTGRHAAQARDASLQTEPKRTHMQRLRFAETALCLLAPHAWGAAAARCRLFFCEKGAIAQGLDLGTRLTQRALKPSLRHCCTLSSRYPLVLPKCLSARCLAHAVLWGRRRRDGTGGNAHASCTGPGARGAAAQALRFSGAAAPVAAPRRSQRVGQKETAAQPPLLHPGRGSLTTVPAV